MESKARPPRQPRLSKQKSVVAPDCPVPPARRRPPPAPTGWRSDGTLNTLQDEETEESDGELPVVTLVDCFSVEECGQRRLERSNSLTLEQREREAADRIINIFNVRSKIQRWKNNVDGNSFKQVRETQLAS